jgi:hypothetical protein
MQEDEMAVAKSTSKSLTQQLHELLERPADTAAQAVVLAEIRTSVEQYEMRYGLPSDRIHDAIDAGDLIEDQDVGHWIFQYDLLHDLLQSVEKE